MVKIFTLLIFSPITLLCLIFLLSHRHYKNKKRRSIHKYGFLIFLFVIYFFSTSIGSNLLVLPLETQNPLATQEILEHVNGYIILAGGQNEGAPVSFRDTKSTPSKEGLARLVEGVRCYHKVSKKIYISGGDPLDTNLLSEATVYKNLLVDLGIPPQDIITEDKSKTTFENAEKTRELLDLTKPYLLITSALHMPRSKMIFEEFKIQVIPNPTGHLGSYAAFNFYSLIPSYYELNNSRNALWEYIGYLFYCVRILFS